MKPTLLAAVIGLATLSAACTTVTGGAKPGPDSGGTTTSTSGTTSGLESIKPCDLLTQTEVTGLGLEYPGEAQKVGAADQCRWKVSGDGGVSAGIRTKAGIKDLTIAGDKKSETKVGRFDAIKVEGAEGAKNICSLWISVTENSSVSVIGNVSLTKEDLPAACDRATKAADMIAAKLP